MIVKLLVNCYCPPCSYYIQFKNPITLRFLLWWSPHTKFDHNSSIDTFSQNRLVSLPNNPVRSCQNFRKQPMDSLSPGGKPRAARRYNSAYQIAESSTPANGFIPLTNSSLLPSTSNCSNTSMITGLPILDQTLNFLPSFYLLQFIHNHIPSRAWT